MTSAAVVEQQSCEQVRRFQLEGNAQLSEGVESLGREQPHDCVALGLWTLGSCNGIPLLGRKSSLQLQSKDFYSLASGNLAGPSLICHDPLLVKVAQDCGRGELLGQLILVAFQEPRDRTRSWHPVFVF